MISELIERDKEIEKLKDYNEKLHICIRDYVELLQERDKEIERLHSIIKEAIEYIDEHIKYECDNAFNGMQFYSYHLYDFNKNKLLEILDKVEEKI